MVELHPLRVINDGTDKAARIGLGRLRDGKTALGAVLKVRVNFNTSLASRYNLPYNSFQNFLPAWSFSYNSYF